MDRHLGTIGLAQKCICLCSEAFIYYGFNATVNKYYFLKLFIIITLFTCLLSLPMPIGIPNAGLTCHMSSALQMLWALECVTQPLAQHQLDHNNIGKKT